MLKIEDVKYILKQTDFCKFVDENKKPVIISSNFFRVLVDNPEFRKIAYQNFLYRGNKFLTGFLPIVLKAYPHLQVIETYDKLQPESIENLILSKSLRENQLEVLKITIEIQRGILWLATNFGKSLVICGICKLFPRNKITVLSYGLSLIAQTHKTLEEELNEKVGIITGKSKFIPENRVNICSINTLAKRKWQLAEEILLVDECHLFSAKNGFKYCSKSKASMKIGFSGTALQNKQDKNIKTLNQFSVRDAKLVGILGEVLLQVSNRQLIDAEISAKPEVKIYPIKCPKTQNYPDAVLKGIVKNNLFSFKIKDILQTITKGEYVLIFVNRIDHGKELSRILNCPFAFSETPIEERVYDKNRVLIANKIFDLGMNLPCDHLFLACGGRGDTEVKNANQILQRVGRGLRRTSENLIIHDFYLFGNDYLEKHSKERLNLWKKEQFPLTIMQNQKI